MRSVLETWHALDLADDEGWPGPEACFLDLTAEGSTEDSAMCVVAPFILDPANREGPLPYVAEEMLIARNLHDIAAASAALSLFPDNEDADNQSYLQLLRDMLDVRDLRELSDESDWFSLDIHVKPGSHLGWGVDELTGGITRDALVAEASADNIVVFAPSLAMSTGGSFDADIRRRLPHHGISIEDDGSRTYIGELIQPPGDTSRGAARSVYEYLVGWAVDDPTMDYSLVGDELLAP